MPKGCVWPRTFCVDADAHLCQHGTSKHHLMQGESVRSPVQETEAAKGRAVETGAQGSASAGS